MKKIVFFDTGESEQSLLLKELAVNDGFDLSFYQSSLDAQTAAIASDAEGIGVFIHSKIEQEALDLLPQLKTIVAMSTGFDHINLDACKSRGITVCNVPSYADNTVVEYAFGLIIALARKLKPTLNRIERGNFSRSGLIGTDLAGKTLGLIGTGRIGSCMARIGRAFDMKVIAHDRRADTALEEKYGVVFMDIEELLRQADVISLHVPYLPSTHHLINAERLRLVKPTAMLINTARGKVVDTRAVAAALREDRLAGVALDSFEGEDIWIEEEFLKHDDLAALPLREALESFLIMRSERAILTPHNAFNTKEALERILIISAQNFKAYFSGNPQNVII